MESDLFRELSNAISSERIKRYRDAEQSDLAAVTRYLWNITLCETLLAPLSLYEVALRNAAHSALTDKYGTPDWFDQVLKGKTLADFTKQRRKIEHRRGPDVTIGKIISETTLGLWTHLFSKANHSIWWDPADAPNFLLNNVLVGKPATNRATRAEFHTRATYFLTLRNRISHHENVCEGIQPPESPKLSIERVHQDLIETIAWFSPTISLLVPAVDRFPTVHTPAAKRLIELEIKQLYGLS